MNDAAAGSREDDQGMDANNREEAQVLEADRVYRDRLEFLRFIRTLARVIACSVLIMLMAISAGTVLLSDGADSKKILLPLALSILPLAALLVLRSGRGETGVSLPGSVHSGGESGPGEPARNAEESRL